MFTLFGLLPLSLLWIGVYLQTWLLPLLVCMATLCSVILLSDARFKRKKFGWRKTTKYDVIDVLIRFLFVCAITLIIVLLWFPDSLFYLLGENLHAWLLILLLYPLFSALPQEIIYRTFLLHRYKPIVNSKQNRIYLSSLCFGIAHIFYGNWIALVLSLIAGYIFCYTYLKTKSTLLVTLEHSLWGLCLFTIGLGEKFDTNVVF